MADLIVTGTRIWTANPEQPFAEAMAISGDSILAIGSKEEINQLRDQETVVIEGVGQLILPGFTDSHLHFLEGGLSLSCVQLKDARNRQEFQNRIKDFAAQMNPGEWMLLGYWDHENWGGELPSCEWIDEFTADIPVFLSRSDGHMALANSAAMRIAGISKTTKAPVGGEIERFADGSPTGIFKDNAMPLISRHIPDYSAEQYKLGLEAAMRFVASHGVTSVHHMGTLQDFDIFKRYHDSTGLRTRIYATAPLSQYKQILQKQAQSGPNPWLRLNGAKIFADGSLGSKTAAFTLPYSDDPDESGLLMDDPENMKEGILSADSAGLQVVIHAIGDRANHLILDIFENTIQQNGVRDRRFRIEHAQHLLPEDISRFKELGVIASMQPWHLMDDGRWADRSIGTERSAYAYCFRQLIDAGAILAFGSDWFVAPPVPLEGIYAALTRQVLDGSLPNGWNPQEKITLEEALKAYTIQAAYASFDETNRGSLEPGKLADFIILDQNLFELKAENIRQVQVLSTYIGGELIYKKD